MKFALRDVKPNPFRRMEKYPIDPEKVAALVESINTTGFWETIVGREVNGRLEIAFGHHRLAALREIYSSSEEFDWRVKKLSDAEMIQMMSRENNETYATNSAVLIESIRATVDAYAEGKISLGEMPIPSKTNDEFIRNAPSFLLSGTPGVPHPYTAQSLALFLGMVKPGEQDKPNERFTGAIWALELIDQGILKESTLKGIGTKQLFHLAGELRRTHREALKKAAEYRAAAKEKEAEAAEKQEALNQQKIKDEEARKASLEKAKKEKDESEAKEIRRKAEEAAKKAADAAAGKQRQIEQDIAEAARNNAVARKEEAAAKEEIRETAREVVEQVKIGNVPYKQIKETVRETTERRNPRPSHRPESSANISKETFDKFVEALKNSRTTGTLKLKDSVPSNVVKDARELISAGLRALALKRHPDHGGSQEGMQRLNAAAEWLKLLVSREEDK
jgi:hypothetical protein